MATPHFHWFSPPKTDNRDLVAKPGTERIATHGYRVDIARAAERNGFESILFMTSQVVADPWIAATALVNSTSRIKFIVAVRPGFWRGLCNIEYGQRISYLEQSRALGDEKAIRAVAQANGQNPIVIIIPCHRVVSADGGLGGYSSGLLRKQYLLDLERGDRLL
jgi:O-6-methylguanine DNA methyltransferase